MRSAYEAILECVTGVLYLGDAELFLSDEDDEDGWVSRGVMWESGDVEKDRVALEVLVMTLENGGATGLKLNRGDGRILVEGRKRE